MQDFEFETGVWAVVTVAGGKKLIGSVSAAEDDEDHVFGLINERMPVTINPAFEMLISHMPVRDDGGNVGFQRIVRCTPVDNCLGPAKVHVIVEGIHLFRDMQEEDVIEHKRLVEQLLLMLREARAARHGIQIPKVSAGGIIAP